MTMAQATPEKRSRSRSAARDAQADRSADGAKRDALAERLRAKAAEADEGAWVSLAGLSDEEIVAALTTRR